MRHDAASPALGGPVTGGAATQGLVIFKGKVSSLDAAVTGSFTVSKVTASDDGAAPEPGVNVIVAEPVTVYVELAAS